MPDGISFNVITAPFKAELADREARMKRGAMWSLRAGGRLVKQESKRAAPVLADQGYGYARAGAYRKAYRARTHGGVQGPIVGEGQPVRGLLRQSISSSRQLKNLGGVEWSLKVGPRGPRVHLYAAKIEAKQPYMARGYAAVSAGMEAIWADMARKVWAKK